MRGLCVGEATSSYAILRSANTLWEPIPYRYGTVTMTVLSFNKQKVSTTIFPVDPQWVFVKPPVVELSLVENRVSVAIRSLECGHEPTAPSLGKRQPSGRCDTNSQSERLEESTPFHPGTPRDSNSCSHDPSPSGFSGPPSPAPGSVLEYCATSASSSLIRPSALRSL